ncbi:MAG: hydroxyethylthiazole kinase [Bacilli bacterium]
MEEFKLIEKIRKNNPLIHNITNEVVANDVANSLLAIGASPMMAYAPEEMEEVAGIAKSIVLNIGTLTTEMLKSMLLVGKFANKNGIPVILDPVGVGATTFRKESVEQLLSEIEVQLIRGNAGELARIANIPWTSKGVDAGEGNVLVKDIAEIVANRYQTVVAISGEEDIISDGIQTIGVLNGHPLMTKITGTGCMLSGICGAFIAVGTRTMTIFESTVEACTVYAIAGELAVESLDFSGPGKFRSAFIDNLYSINSEKIMNRLKLIHYNDKESE